MTEALCKVTECLVLEAEGAGTPDKYRNIPRGYVEMTFVKETATGRERNAKFIMEDLKNGTMKLTEGHIGITVGRYKPHVSYRPVSDRDLVYNSGALRGYLATSTHKMGKIEVRKGKTGRGLDYAPVEAPKVQAFIEELARYQQ